MIKIALWTIGLKTLIANHRINHWLILCAKKRSGTHCQRVQVLLLLQTIYDNQIMEICHNAIVEE